MGYGWIIARRRWLGFLAAAAFLVGPSIPLSRAQDLSEELDSIEDPPEDDLSDLDAPKANAKPAPKAATPPPATEPAAPAEPVVPPAAEDLPPDADAPADDLDLDSLEPPADDAASGDLSGDLDAVEGDNQSRPAEALTGADTGPTGKVVNIAFKQLADRVRLTVRADRSIEWSRELRSKRRQVIIEMKNLTIARAVLKRPLDTGEFEGPVALVQPYESKAAGFPSVKILFQLRQFVDPTVFRSGNDLMIDFPIVTDGNLFKDKSVAAPVVPRTFLSANGPMDFRGNKITLNVKNADLQDVLNLLSRASGKDFVMGSNTTAKVTLNVRNQPWDQVLSIILLNAKLGYQEIGNTFRIVPLAELKTELEDATKAQAEALKLRPLATRLFPVNYADGTKIEGNLKTFLTKDRGTLAVDPRTKSIVVTDLPEVLERISRYLNSIDKQTSQVLIEGRIVEATQKAAKRFGVNWSTTIPGTNSFGLSANQPSASDPANFGTQLNATFGIGSLMGISAQLRMLESQDESKTIASPRVSVLDNTEALIKQGMIIPITTPPTPEKPNGGTEFKEAVLQLTVTPQVTSDGYVVLNLLLKRDIPVTVEGVRQIETREAKTQMLVESGKTAVIGGIYVDDTIKSKRGFPGLMNLPIFGSFFRDDNKDAKNSNELMMFISPKILNADKAFIVRSQNFESDQPDVSSLKTMDEDVPDDVF